MSEISEQNAKNSNDFARSMADTLARLLASLADYLEKESEFAPQKSLATWIRGSGEVISYPVQGKCAAQLKYELNKNNIPYIALADSNHLIIKAPDMEIVRELNRSVLIAKSNYFQDVDGREMENAIARTDQIQNKEIFTLCDLDKYQVEVLKNKCNQISAGFMVGIVKTDENKFNVSVHGSKVSIDKTDKTSFCKAYMQMALSLYGPNQQIKIAQIDADEEIDLKVEELKGKDGVHYIIGVDDISHFIEINAHEFEYYETSVINGERVDRHIAQCEVSNPNYDSELQRCMDCIYNKAILNSTEELSEHLKTQERNIKSSRPMRNQQQYQNSMATDALSEKIDAMIHRKINTENPVFYNTSEQFEYYQREAYKIIDAFVNGKELSGHSSREMEEIKEILDTHNVNSNMYKNTLPILQDFDCNSHRAKKMEKKKEKEIRKDYGFVNK